MGKRVVLLTLAGLGIVTSCFAVGCANQSPDSEQEHHKTEEKEDKVAVDQIPQPVVDAVKKEVPDGTITDAEKEKKEDKTVYEMDVKSGDTVFEVKISDDGKFISKKIDNEKDEKDEKDEKK